MNDIALSIMMDASLKTALSTARRATGSSVAEFLDGMAVGRVDSALMTCVDPLLYQAVDNEIGFLRGYRARHEART